MTFLRREGLPPLPVSWEDLRKLLADTKIKEYWNSEGTNWDVGDNCFYTFMPSSPEINERAVAYGSRVWLEHAKAGVSKFFQYHLHQSDTAMYFGSGKLLIGYDRSPTPAAVATAVTAWCLDGSAPLPGLRFVVRPTLMSGLPRPNPTGVSGVPARTAVAGPSTMMAECRVSAA